MLFGRVSRKILLTHPKTTPANSVVRHDWNFKWHWLLLSDETEKIPFWQQTHQMCLVQTRIKKYTMSTVKYTAGSCGPVFLPEVLNILFRRMVSWIRSNTNRKNQSLAASVRNLIMGHVSIFHQDNKHQNKHKNGSLSTKWIFYHGCPCPLTWFLQKMSKVNWREEVPTWSCESEGSGEILYEENGLWSLIRCSSNSSGIIGENSELLRWEKDVAIIGCQ